jgi:hypothetical protein
MERARRKGEGKLRQLQTVPFYCWFLLNYFQDDSYVSLLFLFSPFHLAWLYSNVMYKIHGIKCKVLYY